jgi:hypothetical protein
MYKSLNKVIFFQVLRHSMREEEEEKKKKKINNDASRHVERISFEENHVVKYQRKMIERNRYDRQFFHKRDGQNEIM